MTRAEKRDIWIKNIADHQASGQTVRQWCEENHVNYHTFKWWIGRFNKESLFKGSQTNWVALNPVPAGMPKSNQPLNVIIGRCSIEVFPGFDAGTFQAVVQLLTEQC